jgi:hypothetical protein
MSTACRNVGADVVGEEEVVVVVEAGEGVENDVCDGGITFLGREEGFSHMSHNVFI